MAHVNFFEHSVGGGTVEPQTNKILAVQQFSRPKSKTEVMSILGLTGYFASLFMSMPRFLPHYLTWPRRVQEDSLE